MLTFGLARDTARPLSILCVGAHSDDIEIGCGGTMLRLLAEHDDVQVQWVVLGSSGGRDGEAFASAEHFLARAAKKDVVVEHFKNGYFPWAGETIKTYFEALKARTSPDIVFTHYRGDRHQDHRLVSDLTWNTWRSHLILEYEILKYDGDVGSPNVFVHLEAATCRTKVGLLMSSFPSQQDKDWFTADAFFSLLRIRGIESRAPEQYAEAFYGRKVVV